MMDEERGTEDGLQQEHEDEGERSATKDAQNNPPGACNGWERETIIHIRQYCGEENEERRVER
jgi:hypothetical protein